jgi:F-type H+-transporting ATPase subunit a
VNVLAIEFPPISHVIEWPDLFLSGTPFAVNKVVVLMWISAALAFLFVYLAGRNFKLIPTGLQNVGESLVDFIENGIILQTIGPDGLRYLPLLGTFFTFIFLCNIWEIAPAVQMPVNARMALPAVMTGVVWVLYMVLGIVKQGPLGYFKNIMVPPGVPKVILPLVALIEFVSTIFVRPLSLSVRLFANMLAGHLLLVSFAVITAAVWALSLTIVIWPFSFGLLVALTGFEVLVAFLQAFIFTILTAVYIGSSLHPEH